MTRTRRGYFTLSTPLPAVPDVDDLAPRRDPQHNAPVGWVCDLVWLTNGYGLSVLWDTRNLEAAVVQRDRSAQGWSLNRNNPAMRKVNHSGDDIIRIDGPDGGEILSLLLRELSALPRGK